MLVLQVTVSYCTTLVIHHIFFCFYAAVGSRPKKQFASLSQNDSGVSHSVRIDRSISLFTAAVPDTTATVLTSSCVDFVPITDSEDLLFLSKVWNYTGIHVCEKTLVGPTCFRRILQQ
jgi:hypothetical protein